VALKSLDEFRAQATSEVESEKPMTSWNNGTLIELDDDGYATVIEDRAQWYFDQQNNGYKVKRQEAYPNMGDQLDLLWHAIDGDKLDKTSDFYKELKKVKDDNPKPS
jgi:4-hydroxyphenylpyruvate dioxygenase-like putative hemolysin